MALSGQPARARTVFERAAAFVNDVGLLAEEVDTETGELLGNFPQAFSHIGLVNAAWAISEAERRARNCGAGRRAQPWAGEPKSLSEAGLRADRVPSAGPLETSLCTLPVDRPI